MRIHDSHWSNGVLTCGKLVSRLRAWKSLARCELFNRSTSNKASVKLLLCLVFWKGVLYAMNCRGSLNSPENRHPLGPRTLETGLPPKARVMDTYIARESGRAELLNGFPPKGPFMNAISGCVS